MFNCKIDVDEKENTVFIRMKEEEFSELFGEDEYVMEEGRKITHLLNQIVEFSTFKK